MNPSVHIISALVVFGLLFSMGAPLDFVVIAIVTSVIIDVDHFLFGRVAGSYHPKKIYDFCVSENVYESFTPLKIFLSRPLDFRVFPLHNIVLVVFAIYFYLPVGLGLLFHVILDAFFDMSKIYSHGSSCGKYESRCRDTLQ